MQTFRVFGVNERDEGLILRTNEDLLDVNMWFLAFEVGAFGISAT